MLSGNKSDIQSMEKNGKLTILITRSPTESTHEHMETWDISATTDAFLDQKRVNLCEHMIKWHHMSVYERCH